MRGNHYWSVYSLKSSTVTANKIKDAIVSSWQRCNTNMSAHVIFDPMDHLVFLHCDQEFERFLLQSNGFQESPWPPLPAQTEEEVRNLITLHLTPHVSVNRQLAQSLKHLESMADTCVAHQTVCMYPLITIQLYSLYFTLSTVAAVCLLGALSRWTHTEERGTRWWWTAHVPTAKGGSFLSNNSVSFWQCTLQYQ